MYSTAMITIVFSGASSLYMCVSGLLNMQTGMHCKSVCFQSVNVFNLSNKPIIIVSVSLPTQKTEDHLTFLITVPAALFLFLSIFILVCIESVFKRMLRLFSLLIWACLVTMGYLFMFSGGILSPWDQVDKFVLILCMYLHTCVCKKTVGEIGLLIQYLPTIFIQQQLLLLHLSGFEFLYNT